jgi:phosphatidylglycerol lysyltransferase
MTRVERRRIRWFFSGLLVVSAVLDILGALLIQHQTRSQALGALLPESVTLGGRTGAVLAGLALLLLAGGIARGKRVALRLTFAVLIAAIAFDVVKDLDFEGASLSAWILFGLWWFRRYFEADSDPARVRWGMAALGAGVGLAVLYAMGGSLVLGGQLQPEVGMVRTLESLAAALAGNPSRYHALTQRADWFLASLPVVSYGLVILALTQLLRPVLAPRAAAADRERVHELLQTWGSNHISHLAVHGAQSYHWLEDDACVAFTLRGRTALALGDPIGPPDIVARAAREFIAYCDRQDWTPAFYQVDGALYRELGMTLVPIGAEALVRPATFGLAGRARADLRYAVHRCEREGVRFTFAPGPQVLAERSAQLGQVSGIWLQSHKSPELGYSLGTLATLSDPDIVAGLALATDGRLEAFVSWLPVPARKGWTLDLMRRRPDASYGVMEALISRSIEEAGRRGVVEVSLGVAPRIIASGEERGMLDHAMRAMYWGLDRFQRSGTLHRFKTKFGPCWEDRYLAIPGPPALPGVMGALVRAHMPTLSSSAVWLRSALRPGGNPGQRHRVAA